MAFSRNLTGRARVGGSGFTIFTWNSNPIGFARQLAHTSPTPVGPGPTPIHPLDTPYPVDIVTPAAQNIGTLTLQLYELYNQKVWNQMAEIADSVDLVNIFIRMAALATPVTMHKVIRPPALGGQGTVTGGQKSYAEHYHNCVITNVEDGETIEIGTMEITKRITVAYTYMTSDLFDPSKNVAFGLSERTDNLNF